MRRCQTCGVELPENARFCANCGRAFTSSTAFHTAASAEEAPTLISPSTEETITYVASAPLPQPDAAAGKKEDEEEERRRGMIMPLPAPPAANPPVGVHIPMVQGTPSMDGVASVSGTPMGSNLAGSAPPAQTAGSAAISGPAAKKTMGGITKWIIIGLVAVVILAGGATAFAFTTHLFPPNNGTAPTATPGANGVNNKDASATVCAQAPGSSCTGPVTPTTTGGQSTGRFNFSGAQAGAFVITEFRFCGVQGTSYAVNVFGTLNGTPYKFLVGLASYTGPGAYTSNLTVDLIASDNTHAIGNDGRLPVRVVIQPGGKSGTVDSDLKGFLSGIQPATGHVSGSWICH